MKNDTNYVSKDNRICVINNGARNDYGNKLMDTCQSLIVRMFEEGDLANSFTFKEKKRASTKSSTALDCLSSSTQNISSQVSVSSTSSSATSTSKRMRNKKKRKQKKLNKSASKSKSPSSHPDVLPTISLGWSTQNCHQYRKSKCTTAGNIKPCLRDGNLTNQSKELVL